MLGPICDKLSDIEDILAIQPAYRGEKGTYDNILKRLDTIIYRSKDVDVPPLAIGLARAIGIAEKAGSTGGSLDRDLPSSSSRAEGGKVKTARDSTVHYALRTLETLTPAEVRKLEKYAIAYQKHSMQRGLPVVNLLPTIGQAGYLELDTMSLGSDEDDDGLVTIGTFLTAKEGFTMSKKLVDGLNGWHRVEEPASTGGFMYLYLVQITVGEGVAPSSNPLLERQIERLLTEEHSRRRVSLRRLLPASNESDGTFTIFRTETSMVNENTSD